MTLYPAMSGLRPFYSPVETVVGGAVVGTGAGAGVVSNCLGANFQK